MRKRPLQNGVMTATCESDGHENGTVREISRCNFDVHGVPILAYVKRWAALRTSGYPPRQLLVEALYLPIVKEKTRRP